MEGSIAVSRGRGFTARQRAYLLSLPAVRSVGAVRIRYSEGFREECMRRYGRGESPRRIFSDAGAGSGDHRRQADRTVHRPLAEGIRGGPPGRVPGGAVRGEVRDGSDFGARLDALERDVNALREAVGI